MQPSMASAPPWCPASVLGVTHVTGLNCYRCPWTVPGGNLTGISNIQTELYPKRMEVLKATIPTVRRVATIETAAFGRRAMLSQMVQEAARSLGIEALTITFVARVEEIDRAFAQAVQQRDDA